MKVVNHRLVGEGGQFLHGASSGGVIDPIGIVEHDTAGRLTKYQTAEWMASDETTSSYHVIVEVDGSWSQLVPFNRRANHAGASYWKGKSSLNYSYIGIANVSPGRLSKHGRGGKLKNAGFQSYFGVKFPGAKPAKDHNGKLGHWLPYTPAQIATGLKIHEALREAYPRIEHLVTHYEIAPTRKEDVNPLFPLDDFKAVMFSDVAVPSPELVTSPPRPTIRLGDGDDPSDLDGPVFHAQILLMELFYWSGAQDGVFGDMMEVQVMSFQKQNGLDIDGVIGPDTWAALESADAVAFPTSEREAGGKTAFRKTGSTTAETAEAVQLTSGLSLAGGLASITDFSKTATAWQEPLETIKAFAEFIGTGLIPFIFDQWRYVAFFAVTAGLFFAARRVWNARYMDWVTGKHRGK